METGLSQPDIQILHPINLSLSVKRNLSAAWFHKLPVLEIVGYLDAMNVSLEKRSDEKLVIIINVRLTSMLFLDTKLQQAAHLQ